MLYLIWALLNFGLFIFFIGICYNAAKHIREKFGIIASIVFVCGLFSFIGISNKDGNGKSADTHQLQTWRLGMADSVSERYHYFKEVDLEKTLISKYSLAIGYNKDTLVRKAVPISAFSSFTGLQGGTTWRPVSIIVNQSKDGQTFEYEVDGTVGWMLLGMTVYYQSKHWKGVIELP